MYIIDTDGLIFQGSNLFPKPHNIVLRIETRGGFTTLSLSDDEKIMLQIPVTPEILKVFKNL